MAYKSIPKMSIDEMQKYTREEAEKDLVFCGFVVAECPLKPDTKAIISELVGASHEIKMITGDNALTAAFIGQELKFGNGPSLFANSGSNNDQLIWNDIDDKQVAVTKNPTEVAELAKKNMLCINGSVLDNVILSSEPGKTMRPIHVFSRTSPAQKGIIVGLLNLEGHKTLMCGDGTNDVGSLKRADVGLAVVNNKEPTKEDKAKKKQMSPWVPKEQLAGKSWAEVAAIQKAHMENYQKEMQKMAGGEA